MKKILVALSVCLALVLSAGFAVAADKAPASGKVDFQKIDKDENGRVTYNELITFYPSVTQKKFGQMSGGKGYLTQADYDSIDAKQLGMTEKKARQFRKEAAPKIDKGD